LGLRKGVAEVGYPPGRKNKTPARRGDKGGGGQRKEPKVHDSREKKQRPIARDTNQKDTSLKKQRVAP